MPPKGQNPSQKGKQSKPSSSSSSSHSHPSSKPTPSWVAPKAITNPEHHHTLNHLNQVASFYAILSAAASSSAACQLQGEMVRSAKTLSKKAVIRLDTGVKRGSCPKCDTVWVEGLTMQVRSRVSGPHGHVVKLRCGVCGVITRRAAPNLVPSFEGCNEKAEDERGKEGQDAKKRERDEQDMEPGTQKVSQRQRRRTASIKRQLLQAAESEMVTKVSLAASITAEPSTDSCSSFPAATATVTPPQPSRENLSRGQKRKQRLERLALRASASTSAPVQIRGRRKVKGPSPAECRLEYYYFNTRKTSPRILTPAKNPPKPTPLVEKRPTKIGRAQRPLLPHFNDRVESSHWDDSFTTLQQHLNPPPPSFTTPSSQEATSRNPTQIQEYASQALQYWQKAARSRGDHLLVSGVGKNGCLGPTLS
ncbi:uncharacterized protein UTRI_05638 [Ustilago trichophora]|uniref:Uncharacterized protein n=1 Tax=Ustilago trichophora TaxID=86804 RepID=A0A5C3EEH8_9BASI|nr:uncharacterized protein UTRI_05638 [Ustilago trichophora]